METMTDEAREAEIAAQALLVQTGKTVLDKRAAFNRMAQLIAGRSPEVVARLEEQKGLVREIRTMRAA